MSNGWSNYQIDIDNEQGRATGKSYAQMKPGEFCFVCGSTKHKSYQCKEKLTRPRDEWYINNMDKEDDKEENKEEPKCAVQSFAFRMSE